MSKSENQTLFTPFALGEQQLRNRIVMAPMTLGPETPVWSRRTSM